MSDSIVRDHPAVKVIVGVDTHKHEHVAVAIDSLGARLAMFRVPANGAGYAALVAWARTLGDLESFGDRRHRFLRGRPRQVCAPKGASRRRSQPVRPAQAAQRRQERHARRRGRRAVRARRRRDRHPESRRRDGGNGPPDQDRTRFGRQGPYHRGGDPQDAPRECAEPGPRSTRAAHEPEAHRPLRGAQTGRHHRPDCLGEACAAGARAPLAHAGGRDRRARRVARHHHQRDSADPCARHSGLVPTRRPR